MHAHTNTCGHKNQKDLKKEKEKKEKAHACELVRDKSQTWGLVQKWKYVLIVLTGECVFRGLSLHGTD